MIARQSIKFFKIAFLCGRCVWLDFLFNIAYFGVFFFSSKKIVLRLVEEFNRSLLHGILTGTKKHQGVGM